MAGPPCFLPAARAIVGALLLAFLSAPVAASDKGLAPAVMLDELVVTGVQPGPGLWRVSGPQGTGVVWILASVSPLPRDLQWNAQQVQEILATADQVIAPARVEMDIGAGDMFKMASLARAAHAATKLPGGQRLADSLPPELYARWSVLKARHLPDDTKVERQRPLFASQDLYYEAIRDAGLTRSDIAWARVSELATSRGIPVLTPTVRPPLAIDRKAYRAGIRALAESQVDDVTCFDATLEALEPDIAFFTRAANAWSKGDLERLLPMQWMAPTPPCKPVYDRAMSFQQRPGNHERALEAWRAAVEAAVRDGRKALAVLPISDLVGADRVLARLQASGLDLEAPE